MSSHSLICKRNNHFPRWKMLPVNSFLDDKKESEKLSISKCVEFVYFVICLLQQFKYLYDFIAISLLTRCMSINIFLSPTIQLCTNNRDCGLGIIFKSPKLDLRIPPFSLIFLNVQWPYGSLIFNIFATSTSILYLKSARIFGPWNWLATWVKLKFNTILRSYM